MKKTFSEVVTGDKVEQVLIQHVIRDERDIEIAVLDTQRTRTKDDTAEAVTPLTRKIPNAHGQIAVTQTSPESGVIDKDKPPAFKPGAKIYEEMICMIIAGLISFIKMLRERFHVRHSLQMASRVQAFFLM